MLLHALLDSIDGSQCVLAFEAENQWLRATWQGYVDPTEALRGAERYLDRATDFRCPYLLNDNTALYGPWFDSLDWLRHAWLPQAQRLGLRYVAHVVQADTHADVLTLHLPASRSAPESFEIQLFYHLPEAEEWLRACQLSAASA